jgi:hypothetical protein
MCASDIGGGRVGRGFVYYCTMYQTPSSLVLFGWRASRDETRRDETVLCDAMRLKHLPC